MTEHVKQGITKEFVKGSKAASTLTSLRLDGDSRNPIFKPQDIWNAHQELKAKQLGSLTPTQAMTKTLDDTEQWYMDHQKKKYSDELEFLFFTPECMQELLRKNPEVLIMDCTCKTN